MDNRRKYHCQYSGCPAWFYTILSLTAHYRTHKSKPSFRNVVTNHNTEKHARQEGNQPEFNALSTTSTDLYAPSTSTDSFSSRQGCKVIRKTRMPSTPHTGFTVSDLERAIRGDSVGDVQSNINKVPRQTSEESEIERQRQEKGKRIMNLRWAETKEKIDEAFRKMVEGICAPYGGMPEGWRESEPLKKELKKTSQTGVEKLSGELLEERKKVIKLERQLAQERKETKRKLEENEQKGHENLKKAARKIVKLKADLEREVKESDEARIDLAIVNEFREMAVNRYRQQTEQALEELRVCQQRLKKLEDILKCPICLDPMNKVTSTNCGHLSCEKCLNLSVLAKRQAQPPRPAKCPLCNELLNEKLFRRVYGIEATQVDTPNMNVPPPVRASQLSLEAPHSVRPVLPLNDESSDSDPDNDTSSIIQISDDSSPHESIGNLLHELFSDEDDDDE